MNVCTRNGSTLLTGSAVILRNLSRVVVDDTSFGSSSIGPKSLFDERIAVNTVHGKGVIDHHRLSISTSGLYDLLRSCIVKKDLALAREVHSITRSHGLDSNAFLGSHLIRVFTLCGSLSEACLVFSNLSDPTVFTWSAIISAHTASGLNVQSIELYYRMQLSGVKPDGHVIVAVLKACTCAMALVDGKLIHGHVIRSCLESNVFVQNILIDMYCKCGSLEDATVIFGISSEPTVVTWTTMLLGYVQHGHVEEALRCFENIHHKDIQVDDTIFLAVLQACSSLAYLDFGKLVHAQILERGSELNAFVASSLMSLYAKGGSLEDARGLFDRRLKQDVVMWNAIITGYLCHGDELSTFLLFQQMQEKFVEPDEATFVNMMKACSSAQAFDHGRLIHEIALEKGFESRLLLRSSLLDMYIKCGSIEDAHWVFDNSPVRDVVMWSAMIVGFNHIGHLQEAVHLSQKMRKESVEPNPVTFTSVLKVCASISALNQGRHIHIDVVKSGHETNTVVVTALIDMFCKCGSLEDATTLFYNLPKKDVVLWNLIIAGYAEFNNFEMVMQNFELMQKDGVEPNETTFVSLLSSCSHLGLVDKGCYYFNALKDEYGVELTLDHCNCMIDLFGRAGHLKEAEDILKIMPFQCNFLGWTLLLSHCKTHDNLKQGQLCFDNAVAIDDTHSPAYALMASIFAHLGRFDDAEKLEERRKSITDRKMPGEAFLEVNDSTFKFVVGGKGYFENSDILVKLKRLLFLMEVEGYSPQIDIVLGQS